LKVMEEIRSHIAAGTFPEFRREFSARYIPTQKVLSARELAETGKTER
jgi:queuine/archaeosine tRNA-ribosyltransferase